MTSSTATFIGTQFSPNTNAYTPLGTDLESVIIAVCLFMMGGALIFSCCFVVTHCYICIKRKRLSKKQREKEERQNECEYTTLSIDEDDEDSIVPDKNMKGITMI
uniref:Col_cuticle_N domain-containing protein n=1 Tax=Rhabditophanes sp. KR3021 TaxID=114890 RepID=A0AC35UEB2_9BILA